MRQGHPANFVAEPQFDLDFCGPEPVANVVSVNVWPFYFVMLLTMLLLLTSGNTTMAWSTFFTFVERPCSYHYNST